MQNRDFVSFCQHWPRNLAIACHLVLFGTHLPGKKGHLSCNDQQQKPSFWKGVNLKHFSILLNSTSQFSCNTENWERVNWQQDPLLAWHDREAHCKLGSSSHYSQRHHQVWYRLISAGFTLMWDKLTLAGLTWCVISWNQLVWPVVGQADISWPDLMCYKLKSASLTCCGTSWHQLIWPGSYNSSSSSCSCSNVP